LTGSPFPPQGPLERVPLLHRYYEKLRLPTLHPDALRLLRLPVPQLRRLFAPAGLGWMTPVARPAIDAEIVGSPRFLWNPRAHAPLIDPGETSSPCQIGDSVLPSAIVHGVGSHDFPSFGAHSRSLFTPCVRFAARVAPTPRNTRFSAGG
jgi:hypothetical protein